MIIGVNFIPTNVYCNQKIALYGDSLMSGYGLDEKFHLSTILEKNLKHNKFKNPNFLDEKFFFKFNKIDMKKILLQIKKHNE